MAVSYIWAFIAASGGTQVYDLLLYCSYVKLYLTFIKYCSQVQCAPDMARFDQDEDRAADPSSSSLHWRSGVCIRVRAHQLYLNWHRKSTVGWNILNVLLVWAALHSCGYVPHPHSHPRPPLARYRASGHFRSPAVARPAPDQLLDLQYVLIRAAHARAPLICSLTCTWPSPLHRRLVGDPGRRQRAQVWPEPAGDRLRRPVHPAALPLLPRPQRQHLRQGWRTDGTRAGRQFSHEPSQGASALPSVAHPSFPSFPALLHFPTPLSFPFPTLSLPHLPHHSHLSRLSRRSPTRAVRHRSRTARLRRCCRRPTAAPRARRSTSPASARPSAPWPTTSRPSCPKKSPERSCNRARRWGAVHLNPLLCVW